MVKAGMDKFLKLKPRLLSKKTETYDDTEAMLKSGILPPKSPLSTTRERSESLESKPDFSVKKIQVTKD